MAEIHCWSNWYVKLVRFFCYLSTDSTYLSCSSRALFLTPITGGFPIEHGSRRWPTIIQQWASYDNVPHSSSKPVFNDCRSFDIGATVNRLKNKIAENVYRSMASFVSQYSEASRQMYRSITHRNEKPTDPKSAHLFNGY